MTNRKAIRFLLFAVALLALANVYLSFRRGPAPFVQRQTLLDRPAVAGSSRLSIERPGCPDSVFAFSGGEWRLASPFDAAVDQGGIAKIFDFVSFGRILATYSEADLLKYGGHTMSDYGLESPSVTLRFSGEGGVHTVRLGQTTSDSKGVFAAVDGDPLAYIVDSRFVEAVDCGPSRFRVKELLPSGVDSVDSFDLKRGPGSFRSFRRRGGAWMAVGEGVGDSPVSAIRVKALLDALASAVIDGYAWPVGAKDEPKSVTAPLLAGYGLDPESAITVTLRGPGLKDTRVSFGKEAGEGRVYALVQNEGAVAMVEGSVKDAVAEADFTDPRLFPIEYSSVTRVAVGDGDVQYLLVREPGSPWRLDAPVAAAADQAKAERFVKNLLALETPSRSPGGMAVSVSTNLPTVSVATADALGEVALPDLRSREVMAVDPAAVRRVSVSGPDAPKAATVVYDADLRCWTVESADQGKGAEVDEAAVKGLLAALNPLSADKVVKLKVAPDDLYSYSLKPPRMTIAIDSSRGEEWRRNILVGGHAQGGRFATLGSSDTVFIIPDASVKAFSSPLIKE